MSDTNNTITIDKLYYDKLETIYTPDETKQIIHKFIENQTYFCKYLMPNLTNNLQSLIITLINNLYQDNQLNHIDYNTIDEYLNQTPQERCPESWNEIIKKTEFIEDKKNNIYTTDIYECYRCHNRRCTIEIIQTRSADEPATTFVNCIVCGNHWAN
jgi:DNA-directed RNA polymerase subunit M/transcription elongation factor TFIIS